MEEDGVANTYNKWCRHCGKDRDLPVREEIKMDKYVHFGVSDYEDDEYCTVSTEELDMSDLECDEEWNPVGLPDMSYIRVLSELSQKSK